MKRLSLRMLMVSILSTIVLAGPVNAQTLELGIPLPLTGSQAKFGEMEMRAYQIAVEEINAAGGIKGRTVVLTFEDNQGKPEISRAIAENLIDVKKQPLIFGDYSSSCSKAIAAVANERKVPYLVVTGADDAITQQNYSYVFRMNPTNAYYVEGLGGFLTKVVKPKSIAILYESSDFGTSGAAEMEKYAQKIGMKVLLKEKYDKGEVNFKPILNQVKAKKPDVIYMVSYAMDASLLMKQIKELRINAKLFAGGAAGFAIPEFIHSARDAAEYVVTITLWSPAVLYPDAKKFAENYKGRYGEYPSYHGAEAYSALYVVKDALERARRMEPADIQVAMKETDMMTAFGPIRFQDKNGYQNQNFMDTLVLQVIKGKHETVWPASSAGTKPVYPIPEWRKRD
ncbi:ABC transporter substrate-binding protein [Desulfosarcina sp. OttesenSCG-928-G10]|nr:ABC transporter substrate-binding protein [Desulfosarcina sp. OttesenSCG-928-G10]